MKAPDEVVGTQVTFHVTNSNDPLNRTIVTHADNFVWNPESGGEGRLIDAKQSDEDPTQATPAKLRGTRSRNQRIAWQWIAEGSKSGDISHLTVTPTGRAAAALKLPVDEALPDEMVKKLQLQFYVQDGPLGVLPKHYHPPQRK